MELVCQTTDKAKAHEIQSLLEENGIPASIAGEQLHDINWQHIPNGLSVWVYINEHLPDAKHLIENPKHCVAHPVNIEEFYQQTQHANNSEALVRFVRSLFMWVLGLVFAMIVGYVLFRAKN